MYIFISVCISIRAFKIIRGRFIITWRAFNPWQWERLTQNVGYACVI